MSIFDENTRADFLIRGGHVVDPSQDVDGVTDVAVRNGKVVGIFPGGSRAQEAFYEVDATGCLVFPGIIDFHTHIFHEGGGFCIRPDMMIANGVTATCDGGSAGCMNYSSFFQSAVVPSAVKIKSFLNIYSGGQLCHAFDEILDMKRFDIPRIQRVVEKYRDSILGLKIRIPQEIVGSGAEGLEPLKRTVEAAEYIGDLKVCVHVTSGPVPAEEIVSVLRPGDVVAHCYHGRDNNIIGEDGHVLPGVWEARKRGVIFDVANGKGNFSLKVAKAAMADGFLPDIISSDMTNDKYNMPPYCKNMPVIMSKFLALGMPLAELIRRVTELPADVMGMKDKIGTLKPGSIADISVFKMEDVKTVQKDFFDEEFEVNRLLTPVMTMCDGVIQYCRTDLFN